MTILMNLLVIGYKYRMSPYFRFFNTFPPYFGEIITCPYFFKFPPDPVKFRSLLHAFCVFHFPLHHTMHVLDAPAGACGTATYELLIGYTDR